jgi:SAM-dependent methyltransferase
MTRYLRLYLYRLKSKLARQLAAFVSGTDGLYENQNQARREAWLKQTLACLPAGQRILDAGAGELQYKCFCTHLNYVSQDFAQYDGLGNGDGLQTGAWDNSRLDIISDITAIPEPDASFDAIMCVEVLEHLPEPISALRELTRLLKPRGTLILTAPACSLTHFSPHFYYTGYSRYFFDHWLTELGCEIEELQYNGNYYEWLAQELRLGVLGGRRAHPGLTWLEQTAAHIVLGALDRFSLCDQGSEQLLSLGLHVRARKLMHASAEES